MPIRQTAHAEEEKAIFEAFLSAYPAFKATIKEFRQPDAEFPDAVVTMLDGSEVDFELGEWLHGAQMGQAKRRERLVESIKGRSDYRTQILPPTWPSCSAPARTRRL